VLADDRLQALTKTLTRAQHSKTKNQKSEKNHRPV